MDHSKKSTYLFSIDALRVIAILAVILIHVTTKTLASLHLDITIAPFSLFLNQAARFAVPLFFLISGFVLELNNKEKLSYMTFFKKRASRILIPYIFWTLLYFLWTNGFNASQLVSLKFLLTVLLGNASYHLYFIPTLILFYIAFPVFHNLLNVIKNPFVFFLIWGIEFILLFEDYYFKQWDFSYDIRIALLSFAMFVTGMVASHYKDSILKFVKKYFIFMGAITILLPIVIFLHVQSLTLKAHSSRFIYNQYSPINYLYTLFLSSFLFYFLEKTQILRPLFIQLSKLSFFVFFIHVLIQSILWDWVLSQLVNKFGEKFLTIAGFDIVLFLIIASISFGCAFVVHKIPFAEKITG